MEKNIYKIICENEGNYPSFYSNFIVHEIVHICNDIRKFGPVHSYWMFGFERTNKFLKSLLHDEKTPHINIVNNYLVNIKNINKNKIIIN